MSAQPHEFSDLVMDATHQCNGIQRIVSAIKMWISEWEISRSVTSNIGNLFSRCPDSKKDPTNHNKELEKQMIPPRNMIKKIRHGAEVELVTESDSHAGGICHSKRKTTTRRNINFPESYS